MSRSLKVHLLLLVVAVALALPFYGFQWHLTLHILGAILFVGGLVSSTLLMALAHRNGEAVIVTFAANAVRKAGLLLVGPAAVLALLNGLMMAADRWGGWGGFHEHRWIEIALALFVLAIVLWGAFVHRYVVRLAKAGEMADDGPICPEAHSVLRRWYFWSGVVLVLSVVILYLMVVKP